MTSLRADAAARVARRRDYLIANRDRLTIDGDVHPTGGEAVPDDVRRRIADDPGYFHGKPLLAERLFAKMDQAGVDMALCWQNPAMLRYGRNEDENAARLAAANEQIAALGEAHWQRVIPAGWTDPKALGRDNAIALARKCVTEFGMPVVKMNPAQNEFPIDDPMVAAVVDAIVELGAVPAFHFGSDSPYTPAEGLERIAQRHPDHPVIGVHMGGGGGNFVEAEETYQAARRIGLSNQNIFYVLSAKRDVYIESALIAYAAAGKPFSRNLAAGSDAPYGDMVWNFGGFRALFDVLAAGRSYGDPRLEENPDLFDGKTIANFMGGNLADLVIAADTRILERNERVDPT